MTPKKPVVPPIGAPPGAMLVMDVAALWGVLPATVWSYRKESQERVGSRRGRYADNPMPEPAGYMSAGKKSPWWRETQRTDLHDWFFKSRAGQGHGSKAAP